MPAKRPRWVTLYPLADEWGPKGAPVLALAAGRADSLKLYRATLPLDVGEEARTGLFTRASDALRAPGQPGWEAFVGLTLTADRLARAQEHCISLPERSWWDDQD